jgi:hypothetical protein
MINPQTIRDTDNYVAMQEQLGFLHRGSPFFNPSYPLPAYATIARTHQFLHALWRSNIDDHFAWGTLAPDLYGNVEITWLNDTATFAFAVVVLAGDGERPFILSWWDGRTMQSRQVSQDAALPLLHVLFKRLAPNV